MSTHSGIAFVNSDGSVKSIYCHNDGYPSYMFNMLVDYYNSAELAESLVDLGDLSSVQKNIWSESHSFDHPIKDTTIAYHRDRGEDYCQNKWSNLDEYLNNAVSSYCADYLYYFKDGRWEYK